VSLCLVAGGVLSSCSSIQQQIDPEPNLSPARTRALVPQEFLYTDYVPLNDWLDTPVRVHITNVPLSEVFHQPALSGLNHSLLDMPDYSEADGEPTVTIDELALTRRQLLWAIGQDYKLAMVPKFDQLGATSLIEISGKVSRRLHGRLD
jgi:hypothetical protein